MDLITEYWCPGLCYHVAFAVFAKTTKIQYPRSWYYFISRKPTRTHGKTTTDNKKIAGYTINVQKLISCYMYKQKPVWMEENVPFVISKHEIKFLGANLIRYAKNLYKKNYKALF